MWIFDILITGALTLALAKLADKVEGWYKTILWFLVVALVISLATVQIIERAGIERENKKLEEGRKTEADEQQKNLTSVISQMTDLRTAIRDLQTRPPNITRIVTQRAPELPPTEELKLRQMSNAAFRQYALDWAKKLRDFDKKYTTEEGVRFSSMPRFGQDQAARDTFMSYWTAEYIRTSTEHLNDYKNNFWGETNAVYNEIVYRYKTVGKTVPEPSAVMPFAIGGGILIKNTLNGELGGPHPIGELADYIEILARGLPN